MATSAVQEFKARRYDTIALPSGLTVQAKRGGVEVFIKSGKIPNSLMPLLKAAMVGDEEAAKALASLDVNPEMLGEMFELFDIVAVATITVPKVWLVPDDESERDAERLYVDEIDGEDKQFLFQWAVGGTADVEKFREQAEQSVVALRQSKEVPSAPQPSLGSA